MKDLCRRSQNMTGCGVSFLSPLQLWPLLCEGAAACGTAIGGGRRRKRHCAVFERFLDVFFLSFFSSPSAMVSVLPHQAR